MRAHTLTLVALAALAAVPYACANPRTPHSGDPELTADLPSLERVRAMIGDPTQVDEALRMTDEILAKHPEHRAARRLRAHGSFDLSSSRPKNAQMLLIDAERDFERILDQDATDAESWLTLAETRLRLSKFDEGADAALQAAMVWQAEGKSARKADALLKVAANKMQMFVEVRRPERESGEKDHRGIVPPGRTSAQLASEVLSHLEAAKAHRPGPAFAQAASVYQWLDDMENALAELERGIRAAPADNAVNGAYIRTNWAMGRQTDVASAYRRLAKDNDVAIYHWWLARVLSSMADQQRDSKAMDKALAMYAEAIDEFDTYSQRYPAHAASAQKEIGAARIARGRVLLEIGRNEDAIAELFAAHDACPDVAKKDANGYPLVMDSFRSFYEGNLSRIGRTYAEQGDEEGLRKALDLFSAVNERHPRTWGGFYNDAGLAARDLGVRVASSGDVVEAQKLWERSYADYCVAVELEPGDPRIVNDCGLMLIYHLHREYDRARMLFDQAIEVGTPMYEALNEDSSEGERNFVEEALGDAYQNVGVLMATQGKPFEEMKPFLEKAVTLYPYQRRQAAVMLRRGNAGQPVFPDRSSGGNGGSRGASARQDPQDSKAKVFKVKIKAAEERAAAQDFDGALLAMDEMAKECRGHAPYHYKFGVYSFEYAKQKRDSGGDAGLVGGLFEDAKRQLQKAVQIDENLLEAHLTLGEVLNETGDYDGARQAASKLISHIASRGTGTDKDLQGAHNLRAHSGARGYIAQRQAGEDPKEIRTEAQTSFRYLDGKGSLDEAGYSMWATMEEWAGDGDAAMKALADGMKRFPTGQTILDSMVSTGARLKKSDAVLAVLDNTQDATALWFRGKARFNRAEELRQEVEFDQAADAAAAAIKDFEASMAKNPQFKQTCELWKAYCLAKLAAMQLLQKPKKIDEAEKNILAALAMRPDQVDGFIAEGETLKVVLLRVADHYYSQRDLENTERIYAAAAKAVPNDGFIANNHGLMARDLADLMRRRGGSDARRAQLYEASYASYRRAVDLEPDNVRLMNDCALILVNHLERNWDEARELLDRGIQLGEKQLREENLIGDDKNVREEAVGDCYQNLALWHIKKDKDYDAAIKAATKSLEFYPGRARGATQGRRQVSGLRIAALRSATLLLLLATGCASSAPAQEIPAQEYEAVLREAQSAEQKGKKAEAAALWLRLAKAKPQDTTTALHAARLLGATGRLNDAVGLLLTARDNNPDVPAVGSLLARTLLLKAETQSATSGIDDNVVGYYEEAVRICRELRAKHPDHRDAHLILSQSLYMLGRLDDARTAATQAQERFPKHPGPTSLLGRMAFDEVRRLTLRLVREGEAMTPEEKATLESQRKDARTRADDAFRKAVELDPGRAFPHRMLGDLALMFEDPTTALEHFRAALSVDPSATIDHRWLETFISVEERIALYEEALLLYRSNKGANPNKAAVLEWYVAKAELDRGSYTEALARFERVLQQRAGDLSARYYAMVAAWWNGDGARAGVHAAAYAKQNAPAFADTVRGLPQDSRKPILDALRWLAADARSGNRAEACRNINQVLAYTLRTAESWNNFALLCWEGGEHERAYDAYVKALEVEPNSPQLLNDAGAVLQHHMATPENLVKARKYYDQCLANAARILADPDATTESKDQARTAQKNAKANLAELK
eukprot:jgi/Undpi1/11721/HiC_scaffold_37.g14016.m1